MASMRPFPEVAGGRCRVRGSGSRAHHGQFSVYSSHFGHAVSKFTGLYGGGSIMGIATVPPTLSLLLSSLELSDAQSL